jgi:hypothetical protein
MTSVIHVVVPCHDAGDAGAAIDATLHSLAAQAADAILRLHVQVAGAGDAALTARLDWWAQALPHLPRACRGIVFSHARTPGASLAEAVVAGVAAAPPAPSDFVAVLEAGDVALPGFLAAIARVAAQFPGSADPDLPGDAVPVDWLGLGLAAIEADGLPVALPDPDIATDDIREGRCDGVRAPLVPLAGMVFRGALWEAALPEVPEDLPFAAGLARAMAARADFVQLRRPLVGIAAEPMRGAPARPAPAAAADTAAEASPGTPSDASASRPGPGATRLELRLRAADPVLVLAAVPLTGGTERILARGGAVALALPPTTGGDAAAPAGALATAHAAGPGFVSRILARVPSAGRLTPQDGMLVLRACASVLATEPAAVLPHLAPEGSLAPAIARARAALPPGHPTAVWFDGMLQTARAT